MPKRFQSKSTLEVLLTIIAFAMLLYHVIYVVFVPRGLVELQVFHLIFAFALVYGAQMLKSEKNWQRLGFLIIMLISISASLYLRINQDALELRIGFPTTVDNYIGLILLFSVFFATQRSWGWIIPIVSGIFIAYAFVGQELPRGLAAPRASWEYIVNYLTTGLSGMLGSLLTASVYYVLFFVILGQLLGTAGIAQLIYEGGKWISRKVKSGPAQVAVWGSALVGTATGSVVANVIVTGSFTIPMMKKLGYAPRFAGAIEAAASSAGQLMPPVMGITAFIMAYFLNVSYFDIVIWGFIPAFLFYICLATGIHFIASRERGIKVPDVESVDWQILIRKGLVFLTGMAVLFYFLINRYSATFAAIWTIFAVLGASFIENLLSRNVKRYVKAIMEGVREGAITAAQIAIILAILGMVAQTMTSTGLGIKLSSFIFRLGQGLLLPTLLMTGLLVILLGMGMPTAAAYVIGAIVAAPGLLKLGLPPVPVHFFIFYIAVYGLLTPPVAVGALVASRVAKAPYIGTAVAASKLAMPVFIIPFAFVYNPEILALGSAIGIITKVGVAIALIVFGQASIWGYFFSPLRWWTRAFAGAIALGFAHDLLTSGASPLVWFSLPAGAVFVAWQLIVRWKTKNYSRLNN